MIYSEIKKDLFTVDDRYYLAHCIAADAAMGAGIAVQFAKKFSAIKLLRYEHNDVGSCKRVGHVFNLITKRVSYGKPTYESLQDSLMTMREECVGLEISKIAMPKIGCGLDGLYWDKVREIIHEVFDDTNIEILVCYI